MENANSIQKRIWEIAEVSRLFMNMRGRLQKLTKENPTVQIKIGKIQVNIGKLLPKNSDNPNDDPLEKIFYIEELAKHIMEENYGELSLSIINIVIKNKEDILNILKTKGLDGKSDDDIKSKLIELLIPDKLVGTQQTNNNLPTSISDQIKNEIDKLGLTKLPIDESKVASKLKEFKECADRRSNEIKNELSNDHNEDTSKGVKEWKETKELIKNKCKVYLPNLKEQIEKEYLLHSTVQRTIPFLVEIANAKSGVEVSNILEQAAEPVGTYKLKYDRFMLSINGFVGVALGGESFSVENVNQDRENSIILSGFAPIGIHAAGPIKKICLECSFGLFVSIFDFGVLVSKNYDDSSVDSQPNVGFTQLFSPGIFATFGHKWFGPLVIGGGVFKTPDLLKQVGQDGKDISVIRYQGFISVDIPIFHFY